MQLTKKEIEQITFGLECIIQDQPDDRDSKFIKQLIQKLEKDRFEDNLVSKFRGLWNSLGETEQEQLWDIMTALRGSDEDEGKENYDLKYATTARIRGELLGKDFRRGFTFLTFARMKSNIIPYSSRRLVESFKKSPSHFKAHVHHAIEALNFYRPKKSMRDLQKFLGNRY